MTRGWRWAWSHGSCFSFFAHSFFLFTHVFIYASRMHDVIHSSCTFLLILHASFHLLLKHDWFILHTRFYSFLTLFVINSSHRSFFILARFFFHSSRTFLIMLHTIFRFSINFSRRMLFILPAPPLPPQHLTSLTPPLATLLIYYKCNVHFDIDLKYGNMRFLA